MTSTITAEKAALRRRVRAYLEGLSPRQRRESDDALFARFLSLPQVEAADTLLLYHGMGAEPDTARLFPALWARGKRLCLPRCLPGHGMEARADPAGQRPAPPPPRDAGAGGGLPPGKPGGHRPGAGARPGLRPLRRAPGQGGGYYDRWLAGFSGFTAALCRAPLLLERLPAEGHDLPVALVLTEEGLYGPVRTSDSRRAGPEAPLLALHGT